MIAIPIYQPQCCINMKNPNWKDWLIIIIETLINLIRNLPTLLKRK